MKHRELATTKKIETTVLQPALTVTVERRRLWGPLMREPLKLAAAEQIIKLMAGTATAAASVTTTKKFSFLIYFPMFLP